MRKLFLLILLNFFLIGLILYLLDVYNLLNVYSTVRQRIFPDSVQDKTVSPYSVEEMKLLESEEHEKIMESFQIREIELNKKEKEHKTKREELEEKERQLLSDNETLNEKKKKWSKKKEDLKAYSKQVKELAATFLNMPPEKAIERLVAIDSDVLIIDILKEIEVLCEKEEKISIVPYLYSLMPKKDAARLLKKSTIAPDL